MYNWSYKLLPQEDVCLNFWATTTTALQQRNVKVPLPQGNVRQSCFCPKTIYLTAAFLPLLATLEMVLVCPFLLS